MRPTARIIFFALASFFLLTPGTALCEDLESSHFIIRDPVINDSGFSGASASFGFFGETGEMLVENSNSEHLEARFGFFNYSSTTGFTGGTSVTTSSASTSPATPAPSATLTPILQLIGTTGNTTVTATVDKQTTDEQQRDTPSFSAITQTILANLSSDYDPTAQNTLQTSTKPAWQAQEQQPEPTRLPLDTTRPANSMTGSGSYTQKPIYPTLEKWFPVDFFWILVLIFSALLWLVFTKIAPMVQKKDENMRSLDIRKPFSSPRIRDARRKKR